MSGASATSRRYAELTASQLPDFPYGAMTSTIITAEGASIFEPLLESGKIDQLADPKQAAGLRAGLEIPAKDYLKAMRIRSLVQKAFREIFAGLVVLLTPSRLGPAPRITQPRAARRACACSANAFRNCSSSPSSDVRCWTR